MNNILSYNVLPNWIKSSLNEKIHDGFGSNQRNIRTWIEDYSIDTIKALFFPESYIFSVSTKFNGKTYSQTSLKNYNEIKAQGETSQHYNEYMETAKVIKSCRGGVDYKGIKRAYLTGMSLCFLAAIATLVLLLISPSIGYVGIKMMYTKKFVWTIVGFTALAIWAIICAVKGRELYLNLDSVYDPSKKVDDLHSDIIKRYSEHRASCKKWAIVWWIVISIIIGIFTGNIVSTFPKSHNSVYWHTEEIVNETYYTEYRVGYIFYSTVKESYSIVSCDASGAVEVIHESKLNNQVAKCKYTGFTTIKTNSSLVLELQLSEIITSPGGEEDGFAQTVTLEIIENYSKLIDQKYPKRYYNVKN